MRLSEFYRLRDKAANFLLVAEGSMTVASPRDEPIQQNFAESQTDIYAGHGVVQFQPSAHDAQGDPGGHGRPAKEKWSLERLSRAWAEGAGMADEPSGTERPWRVIQATAICAVVVLGVNVLLAMGQFSDHFSWGAMFIVVVANPIANLILLALCCA